MSNYTQSTNFATKDALPSGDPLKIVKGTEINTEFNNISVAIATKADLVSPTFTGTPAAPTASAGTSSTQIATTAYADAAIVAERTATATLTNKSLTSPTLTGTPVAPTAAVNTNDTQVATTAYVVAQIADDAPTKTGTGASGTWGINVTGNSGTVTNGVYTTNFTGGNQSLGTSGYQKLPGGLIMQWGNTGALSGGQNLTVTYPIAFPNAVLNVQTTVIVSTDTNEIVFVYNVSTSTFVAANSNPGALAGVYWLAIGY
jgi:hypothetical protein